MKSYDSLLDGDVELQKEIQEVIQEGIQKGIQEKIAESERNGLQQGLQQGIQQGMQQVILDIVEVRFPSLLEVAKQQVVHLNDKSKLSQLTKQITLAPDETTARWTLSTFAA
ncbi:MAG: hypothetical protein NVSMB38_23830 [Ktedonobacteraceae bacterium]